MKTINTFLIEKLRLNKNTKTPYNHGPIGDDVDFVSVNIPKCEDGYIVYLNETWKTFKLPNSAYVIFKDKYRRGYPHFSSSNDFICSMILCENDYEGFNPKDDILFASNELKEILEWYFNYLKIDEMPTKDNWEDWADKYKHNFFNKSQDNIDILAQVYVGEDNWFDKIKPIDYSNMENVVSDFNFEIHK